MRRSVAGQVEYWATLGRIVEHSGLTAQEAQTAIANYEAAARRVRAAQPEPTSQADALLAQFMTAEADGSLAQRVREVVASNRGKATGSTARHGAGSAHTAAPSPNQARLLPARGAQWRG